MTKIELAKTYQDKGWFTGMNCEQIKQEITLLEQQILKIGTSTRYGRRLKIYNNATIAIAKTILEAMAI